MAVVTDKKLIERLDKARNNKLGNNENAVTDQDLINRLDKARKDVEEHNERVKAERAAQAQTEADAQALVARATAPVDVTEPEEVVLEGATQGSAITPTVELLENADIQTVTAVVESTATGIPQGGLENADDALLNIDEDGDGAVTVDEMFDALDGEVVTEGGAPGNTEQDYDEWVEDSGLEEDDI